MANNALQSVIQILHRNGAVIVASLTEAFKSDYGQFSRANNREPLNSAVKILAKSKTDKAIDAAIHAAMLAGNLPAGYVGAVTGKYLAQPEHVREKYEAAIERAVAAFEATIVESGVFADKAPKTEAEKQKAKEEQAAKKQAELDAHVNALIVAGELVRASDVQRGGLGQTELTDKIVALCDTNTILPVNVEYMVANMVRSSAKTVAGALARAIDARALKQDDVLVLAFSLFEKFPEVFSAFAENAKPAKPAEQAKQSDPA